jgi:hypothetical protein
MFHLGGKSNGAISSRPNQVGVKEKLKLKRVYGVSCVVHDHCRPCLSVHAARKTPSKATYDGRLDTSTNRSGPLGCAGGSLKREFENRLDTGWCPLLSAFLHDEIDESRGLFGRYLALIITTKLMALKLVLGLP